MVESLPDDLQEKVAEHPRKYIAKQIADLEEEKRWDASFKRDQENLAAAAQKAKQEIKAGKSMPMDYEQL